MRATAQIIVLATVSLLTIGVLMVTSASMSLDDPPMTLDVVLHAKPVRALGLALLALAIGAVVPVGLLIRGADRIARTSPTRVAWAVLILMGGMLLLAAISPYIPGLGHEANQSRRWVRLPGVPFTFQPSEIVKWGMIPMLAIVLWLRQDAVSTRLRSALPLLAACAFLTVPVALEDLGTGALLAVVAGAMLVSAGVQWWKLAPLGLAALAGGVALILAEPYRMQRIRTFLDPFQDPQGAGYHVIQSMATISAGQGVGRGLGMGVQKFGYLPEDQTDFVFAVIAEELGLAGVALVLFLYLALLWAGLAVVRRQQHLALKLTALGIITTLGVQTAINLLVVTGWAPTKGIPLPLISAGGTAWVMTSASLGLLVAIDRAGADDSADDDDEDGWDEVGGREEEDAGKGDAPPSDWDADDDEDDEWACDDEDEP